MLQAIADIATLGLALLVAVILAFWKAVKTALDVFVKTGTEEGVKRWFESDKWPEELGRALEKSRGIQRQELRFESYGDLWSRLQPLSVYAEGNLSREKVRALSESLMKWYFTHFGGMLLTPHALEFYFAMQELARSARDAPDWETPRISGDHKEKFKNILEGKGKNILEEKVLNEALKIINDLDDPETDLGKWYPEKTGNWKTAIQMLGNQWSALNEEERFVVLQQVGSILRTVLTKDIESRLR